MDDCYARVTLGPETIYTLLESSLSHSLPILQGCLNM